MKVGIHGSDGTGIFLRNSKLWFSSFALEALIQRELANGKGDCFLFEVCAL